MILKLGMEGPDVLNLEVVLQALGFQGFEVDGVFDKKTENVIKYIQKSYKLDVDGKAGPNTLDLIDALYQPLVKNFAPKPTPVVEVDSKTGQYPTGLEELEHVHPILARKVSQIIDMARGEGYNVTTVQGLRTFKEQDALFRKRPRVTKARGGQSYHNYGVAVDLAFIVDGKLSWDERLYKNIGRWASRAGLEWGGNWKFVDKPHVQLAMLPATGRLLEEYNKSGVKGVWSKFIGN